MFFIWIELRICNAYFLSQLSNRKIAEQLRKS